MGVISEMKYATSFFSAACLAIAAASSTAFAEPVPAEQGREAEQLTTLATGDQLVLEGFSGTLAFAGQELVLTNFTGVLGYASESAYAVTAGGSAAIGDDRAPRGRMLLIAPFGQGIVTERFDARRLHTALSKAPLATNYPAALAALENVAGGQDTGVFIGRLGRTNFNVATMGSAQAETARRARTGSTAIREARFTSPNSIAGTEAVIVERFIDALAKGNVDAASQFIDPMPYGGGDTSAMRQVAARALLSDHQWQRLAAAQPEQTGDTTWRVSSDGMTAQVELRRTSDFAFIQSISVGE